MYKHIVDSMSINELLDYADKHNMDPCGYCQYSFRCNHNAINCYGGNPIESACTGDPDNWVDEDKLRELIKEVEEHDEGEV